MLCALLEVGVRREQPCPRLKRRLAMSRVGHVRNVPLLWHAEGGHVVVGVAWNRIRIPVPEFPVGDVGVSHCSSLG